MRVSSKHTAQYVHQGPTLDDLRLAESYREVLKLRAQLRTAECGRAIDAPFLDLDGVDFPLVRNGR